MILTGIKTNIPLHKDLILEDEKFCEQAMDIHYLEKHFLKQIEGNQDEIIVLTLNKNCDSRGFFIYKRIKLRQYTT